MSASARKAFQIYVEQAGRRSLRRLAEDCSKRGIKASLPTLKRWSARFGWQRLAGELDRAAADESMARSVDYRMQALKGRLELIDMAKQRYEWLINPDNADVTPAQRKRAERITVSDFLRIIQMELDAIKLLRSLEVSKQRETASNPRPTNLATYHLDEKMRADVEEYVCRKHGLPAPSKRGPKGSHVRCPPRTPVVRSR